MQGFNQLERETGFEPATSTLARSHSTTELLPPNMMSINDPVPVEQTWRSGVQVFSRMMRRPLRIFIGRYDLAVAHVDDAVAIIGGFGIMRNHEHGLA